MILLLEKMYKKENICMIISRCSKVLYLEVYKVLNQGLSYGEKFFNILQILNNLIQFLFCLKIPLFTCFFTDLTQL